MSHYSVGRVLAAIVVWAGCIAIGIGVLVAVLALASKPAFAGASAGVMIVVWGATAALFGAVSRAVFDLADKARGAVPPQVPESVQIPLARRDPG